VGYIRDQRKFEPSPSITLKGHWMAALGFSTSQKIEVITGPGSWLFGWLRNNRQVKRSRHDWAGIAVYCGSDGGDFRALRSSILAKIHILDPEAIPIIKLTTDR
jgi:toxic protein SymE